MPLSYFGIPRLGHVGSRCVAKVDSPRLSVVQGACQLYDLLRQVLFAIWIRRAWKECASFGSGMVVDSGREI
ncbi:hypothetical protein ACFX15_008005 [Malus domestica]